MKHTKDYDGFSGNIILTMMVESTCEFVVYMKVQCTIRLQISEVLSLWFWFMVLATRHVGLQVTVRYNELNLVGLWSQSVTRTWVSSHRQWSSETCTSTHHRLLHSTRTFKLSAGCTCWTNDSSCNASVRYSNTLLWLGHHAMYSHKSIISKSVLPVILLGERWMPDSGICTRKWHTSLWLVKLKNCAFDWVTVT